MTDDPGRNEHPFGSMALLGAVAVALAFMGLRQARGEPGRAWAAAAGLTAGVVCLIIGTVGLAMFAAFGALADFFF